MWSYCPLVCAVRIVKQLLNVLDELSGASSTSQQDPYSAAPRSEQKQAQHGEAEQAQGRLHQSALGGAFCNIQPKGFFCRHMNPIQPPACSDSPTTGES